MAVPVPPGALGTPAHHFVRTPAGVDMPRLIYGTAWKKELTQQHVLTALRLGFKGIDTACQPKHYREDLVGAAVRQALQEKVLEDRSQVFLQTKFTSLDGQDPKNVPYDSGAPLVDQVKQSFAKSLENLGTEYVDSVVLHSPLRTYEQTLTAWRVLEGFHSQGKIRQLGMSNTYDVSLLRRLFEDAAVKPAVVQNRFYQQSGYDLGLRAFCREKGIVYQSFWTLTANPHLLKSQPIRSIAARLQCTPEQAFFRFVMRLGIAPLTGTTNPEHMRQDLAVMDLPELSQEEFQAVADLIGGS